MTVPKLSLVPEGEEPERRVDEEPVEVWPSPAKPLEVAYALAEEKTGDYKTRLIQRWRDSWWEYQAPRWVEVEEAAIRDWIYNRLRDVVYQAPNSKTGQIEDKEWNPDATKVNKVIDAYGSAVARLSRDVEPGTWLPTREQVPGLVATPSGLLNVRTRRLHPATPALFTTWALPYDYDPAAPEPTAWLEFLHSVWPEDNRKDNITMLQEWMGYLVSGRTDLHKALLLVGEKRSGKGTILRTCSALIGKVNAASPTLSEMTTQFGLSKAIGKTLLTVGDARLSGNTSTLVERILSITGEDDIQVDRKHQEPWSGRLQTRIMIASNEVPDFRDASGAVGSRFMVVRTPHSFYGREDKDLEQKIRAELPGILKWALEGLDRLDERGRFAESAQSIVEREDMESSESPASQFLEKACVLRSGYEIPADVLYAVWDEWRERNRFAPTNSATFGKNLRAARGSIGKKRGGKDGARVQVYTGVSVRRSYVGTDFANSEIADYKVRDLARPYAAPDPDSDTGEAPAPGALRWDAKDADSPF